MIKESILYDKLNNDEVKCKICNQYCTIKNHQTGFCLTRKNENGKLYSVDYGIISSESIDPIEKKPLYHFLPGSLTYSIGSFGCNMRCLNCQNYMISQNCDRYDKNIEILPETIVQNAINNDCQSIAFTYNEPMMFLEYSLEIAKLSHKNNLKTIYVSNGYMGDESLEILLSNIDGFNIDLKSMSNDFYKKICKATLNPILNNLRKIYNNGNHLEITNLLINSLNDSDEMIEKLVNFIVTELGEEIPLHFSRFFPYYKMKDIQPTSLESLKRAKQIAIDSGIEYVYLGNVQSDQNSYCPNCGMELFERNNYETIKINKIKDNKCINCNEKLNFIE